MESYRISLRLLYYGLLVEIQERVDKCIELCPVGGYSKSILEDLKNAKEVLDKKRLPSGKRRVWNGAEKG